MADEGDSKSVTNNDNQERSTLSEQGNNTSKKQKDGNAVDTILITEKTLNNDNSQTNSSEKATTKSTEADFDTAAISTDCSNSSIVSNAATSTPTEMSKLKAIYQNNAAAEKPPPSNDISNVLQANPNNSMPQMLPGEEDLNLEFEVPFARVQRSPDNWIRIPTFIRYDNCTQRLWEELQKPYGNQSSFLRHLVLLEKYFRNGDLVLSDSASKNARVYTKTANQPSTSHDKGHCGGGLHTGTGVPKKNKDFPYIADQRKDIKTDHSKEIDHNIPKFEDDSDVKKKSIEKLPKLSLAPSTSARQRGSNTMPLDQPITVLARPEDFAVNTSNSIRNTPPQKSLLKDYLVQHYTNSGSKTTNAANLAEPAVSLTDFTESAATANGSSNSCSNYKFHMLGFRKPPELIKSSSSANTTITNTSTNLIAPLPSTNTPAFIQPAQPPPTPEAEIKQQKILETINNLFDNQSEAPANIPNRNQASLLSAPPELVSLQRRWTTAQLNATAAGNANNNNNYSQQSPNLFKRPELLVKPGTSRPPSNVIPPDTLTPQERLQSKTLRRTHTPVEEYNNLFNQNMYQPQTGNDYRLHAENRQWQQQQNVGQQPFLPFNIFENHRITIERASEGFNNRNRGHSADSSRYLTIPDTTIITTISSVETSIDANANFTNNVMPLVADVLINATSTGIVNPPYSSTPAHINTPWLRNNFSDNNQLLQNSGGVAGSSVTSNVNLPKPPALLTQSNNPTSTITGSSNPVNQLRQLQNRHAEQQRQLQNKRLQQQQQQAIIQAATSPLNTLNQENVGASSLHYQAATSNVMRPLHISIDTNEDFTLTMKPMNSSDAAAAGDDSVTSNPNTSKLPLLRIETNNPTSTLTNISNVAELQQQQPQQFVFPKIPKSITVIPQHKLMNNTNTGGTCISGRSDGGQMN